MVNRLVTIAFFWLTFVAVGVAQTQDTDAQTLEQILRELRAIHQDMRVTETTQLLVAELQMQQAVVNRATENADNTRTKLNQIHIDQKRVADDLARAEDQLYKAQNADERTAFSQEVDRHKSNASALKTSERDLSLTEQDMEQRLQNAQDKLASIETELNAAISRFGPIPRDTGQR